MRNSVHRSGKSARKTGTGVTSILCLAIVSALVCADAGAQEVDQSGNCPADVKISREGKIDYFTIVGAPELYVGADDDTLLDVMMSESMPMLTRLHMVKKTDVRLFFKSKRNLVDSRSICGWISNEDILLVDAPKKTVDTDVQWTDPVTGQSKVIANPLARKALLRSNLEFQSENVTKVTIYNKPTITSEPRTSATVFGVYFIYAERELDSGFWSWIAGEDPATKTPFAGWVPEDHLLFWDSQLSLYFNEVEKGTDIFATRDFAATGDVQGSLGKRPDDFIERTIGSESEAGSTRNIARFPILNEESSSAKRGQSLYRIGFFGDDKSVEDSSSRAKIQQNVGNVDMLFVLDNTLSMTEYFASVVSAVRNASERITQINETEGFNVNVKFAAATYGDYQTPAADLDEVQFEIVSGLGLPGYTDHLGKLTDIAQSNDYYRDSLDDKPEAGLAGIVLGINTLQWTDDTEFKVVVWIGDHGSRNKGDNEQVSVADVKQAMVENKVILLPINVSGRYDDQWNAQFVNQGDQLASLRGDIGTLLAHAGGQSNDYAEAQAFIEQSIFTMYTTSLATSSAIAAGTSVKETLTQRPDLFDLGIPAAASDVESISTAICEMAFGNQGCVNLKKSGQFMTEGYVRYDANLKNYSYWVNLTEIQLELVQLVLEKTCKGFERGNVKKYIENAMTLVQNSMEGERYRGDIPIGEYLRRFFLLPRGHFPSFLESTPDLIDEAWQEARDEDSNKGNLERTSAVADPICRSAKLLELVIDNKRLENLETDLVRTASIASNETSYLWSVVDNDKVIDFDWLWAQGGDNNYYYIPIEYLPGDIKSQ